MYCHTTQAQSVIDKNAIYVTSIIMYNILITYMSLCFRNSVEDAAVVSKGTELVVGHERRVMTRCT